MMYRFALYIIALMPLVGGCMKPAVLTSSKDPDLAGRPFRKVAVVADTTDVGWRQMLESHVAYWSDELDLSTVPSLMILSPSRTWTDDERRAALKAQGVDAMLVLRPLRSGIDSAYIPPRTISTMTTDVKASSKDRTARSDAKTSTDATSKTNTTDTTKQTTTVTLDSNSRRSSDATRTRTTGASESIVTRSEAYTTEGYMSRSPWVDLSMNIVELGTGRIVWMASDRLYDNADGRRYLAERLAVTLDHDGVIQKR